MAKRLVGESKEAVEEMKELAKEPIPEISFNEAEVQAVADFINYCYKNGTYTMGMDGAVKLNKMLSAMHNHVTKIEKYIFEFKRTVAAKKAVEP